MTARIADRAVAVAVSEPQAIARGFLNYDRYQISITRDGESPLAQQRDVIGAGGVAAVLPVDVARGQVVLLRQFRLAAHLATGRGELIEIVAGRVETGESALEAARRECFEEIGSQPSKLVELYSVLSTPGITDELVTFFVGFVDASAVQARGGTDDSEDTRPFAVAIDDALAALNEGAVRNALLVSALQWLALHKDELSEMARS